MYKVRSRDIKRRILDYIRRYWLVNGCSPSREEIRRAVGIASKSTVSYHLVDLRHDGFIDYEDAISRSIRITECDV